MYSFIRRLSFDLFVAYILSGMGLLTILLNLYLILLTPESLNGSVLDWISFLVTTLLGLTLIIMTILAHKYPYPFRKLIQILQVFILIFFSGLSILDSFEGAYGIPLFLLGTLLAFKYKLLNIKRILLLSFYIIGLTVLAAYLDGRIHASFLSIAFYLFFLLIMGYAYLDSVQRIRARNRKLQDVISELKNELLNKEQISSQLTAIRLDVDDFSFTPAEKELMDLMCRKGITSNKEIASELNKSVSTVKSQMFSIFEKTGIHKRSQLIAFFRE